MIRPLPQCSEAQQKDADDWLNSDEHEPGWRLLTEEEIINGQIDESNHEENVSDDEREGGEGPDLGDEEYYNEHEALKGLNYAIKYYQATWDCIPDDLRVLQKIQPYIISEVLHDNLL